MLKEFLEKFSIFKGNIEYNEKVNIYRSQFSNLLNKLKTIS